MSSLIQTLFDLWHHAAAAPATNQIDPSTASATGTAAAAPALAASAAPPGPPGAPSAPGGSQSSGGGGASGGGADAGAPQQIPGSSIPAYSPLGLQDGPVGPPQSPMPNLADRQPGGFFLNDAGAPPGPSHWSGWDLNVPQAPGGSLPGPSNYNGPDYDPTHLNPNNAPSGTLTGPSEGIGLSWDTTSKPPTTPTVVVTPPGTAEGSGDLNWDPTKPLIPPDPPPPPPPVLNPPGPHPPMLHVQSQVQSWTPAVLNPDGTTSIRYPDGTQDVRAPDGNCWRLAPNGAVLHAWQEPPVPQWQPPENGRPAG